MTGCEFATLPDPCAAFFTWQDHLHAGAYLWTWHNEKVAKSVHCGSQHWFNEKAAIVAAFKFCDPVLAHDWL